MGELTLIKQEEQLLTVQQIAEKHSVTERTIRNWIAELNIIPVMLDKSGPGVPVPYYEAVNSETWISELKDKGLVDRLSDKSKLKFMIGHVELEGSPEQKEAIRAYVDGLTAQLEAKTRQLLLADRTNEKLQDDLEEAEERINELELNNVEAETDADTAIVMTESIWEEVTWIMSKLKVNFDKFRAAQEQYELKHPGHYSYSDGVVARAKLNLIQRSA